VEKKPVALDPEKLGALFDQAQGTHAYPFIVVAADSGCRRGGLLALTWTDLSLEAGEIIVSKNLEQTKAGGLRVKCPKSGKSRRVALSDWALQVLADHRREQDHDRALFGPDYKPHGLIFCQPTGDCYSPDRAGARVAELMKKAGLDGFSMHSLRHSHASISISRGVPIAVVSERLGHRSEHHTFHLQPRLAGRQTRRDEDLER